MPARPSLTTWPGSATPTWPPPPCTPRSLAIAAARPGVVEAGQSSDSLPGSVVTVQTQTPGADAPGSPNPGSPDQLLALCLNMARRAKAAADVLAGVLTADK